MQTPLEVIGSFGAPTDSFITATHFFQHERGPLKKDQYEKTIAEIVGADDVPSFTNEKESRLYFLYTVQETVRAYQNGEVPDMADVWEEVNRRAKKFIIENPWSIKDYGGVDDDGVDIPGKPKRKKKGAKGQLAEEIYLRLNNGNNDRPTIIQALIDEAEMSKAGATTYFHNFKKKHGFSGPKTERKKREKKTAPLKKVEGKRRTGPSKGQVAEEVYLEMVGSDKKDIIAAIVEKTGTTPAGANTYYCAAKKKHG